MALTFAVWSGTQVASNLRRRVQRALRVALVATVAGVSVAADRKPTSGPPQSPELTAILERFDRVQESIQTLTADLTMTTVNRLLVEPVVYRGRFYMTKPNAVRWEFTTPEEMRFVIADDQYVGYYPAQKKAERKNVQRWSTQLFRYFGLGQGSAELGQFYHIRLAEPDPRVPGTELLVLEPKKRRARKRVEEVKLWIGTDTLLPVRVEYASTEGDVRTVEFHGLRTNVELATGLFRVELPADVEVTTGFTPFGAAGPGI